MPQHNPAQVTARPCRNCDGFPVVAITLGGRHPDGSRKTFRAVCPACQGTGHHTPTPAPARARVGR